MLFNVRQSKIIIFNDLGSLYKREREREGAREISSINACEWRKKEQKDADTTFLDNIYIGLKVRRLHKLRFSQLKIT